MELKKIYIFCLIGVLGVLHNYHSFSMNSVNSVHYVLIEQPAKHTDRDKTCCSFIHDFLKHLRFIFKDIVDQKNNLQNTPAKELKTFCENNNTENIDQNLRDSDDYSPYKTGIKEVIKIFDDISPDISPKNIKNEEYEISSDSSSSPNSPAQSTKPFNAKDLIISSDSSSSESSSTSSCQSDI